MIKQLVIHVNMRSEVLKTYHDAIVGGGHKCGVRIYAAIRQIYYWPQLFRDVEEYAKYCEACQKSKRLTKSATAPLHPLPVTDTFNRWYMDILGPSTTTPDGYKYILVLMDSFSK